MGQPSLRETVEAQALARVRQDAATFASYMTPQAVVTLGGNGLGAPRVGRARRYEIVDVTEDADRGTSEVRFHGAGSYVIRARWRLTGGAWRAVEATIPHESITLPWWRRLFGASPKPEPVERRPLQ